MNMKYVLIMFSLFLNSFLVQADSRVKTTSKLIVRDFNDLKISLPDIILTGQIHSGGFKEIFHTNEHYYLFVDDKLNSKRFDSEIIKLNQNLEVVDRISFTLPDGVTPWAWFVDAAEEAIYIASRNWCPLLGQCPPVMKTYISKLLLSSGKIKHSENFGESIDLSFQPLSNKKLLLTTSLKKSKKWQGNFWIISMSNLKKEKSKRLKERPLRVKIGNNGFMAGYDNVEIFGNDGKRLGHIDSKYNFGSSFAGRYFYQKDGKILLVTDDRYYSNFISFDLNSGTSKRINTIPIHGLFPRMAEMADGSLIFDGSVSTEKEKILEPHALILKEDFSDYEIIQPQLKNPVERYNRQYLDSADKGLFYAVDHSSKLKHETEIYFLDYETREFTLLQTIPLLISSIKKAADNSLLFFSHYRVPVQRIATLRFDHKE